MYGKSIKSPLLRLQYIYKRYNIFFLAFSGGIIGPSFIFIFFTHSFNSVFVMAISKSQYITDLLDNKNINLFDLILLY